MKLTDITNRSLVESDGEHPKIALIKMAIKQLKISNKQKVPADKMNDAMVQQAVDIFNDSSVNIYDVMSSLEGIKNTFREVVGVRGMEYDLRFIAKSTNNKFLPEPVTDRVANALGVVGNAVNDIKERAIALNYMLNALQDMREIANMSSSNDAADARLAKSVATATLKQLGVK